MYFKGACEFLLGITIIAGIRPEFVEGQELCHKAAKDLPCCTCTRQPARLLCQSACPSGYFPPADMTPVEPCEAPATNSALPPHHRSVSDDTAWLPSTVSVGSRDMFDRHVTTTPRTDNTGSSIPPKTTTEPRHIVCIPCDIACAQCIGFGPHNCTKSANDQEPEDNNGRTWVKKSSVIVQIACGAGAFVLVLVLVTVLVWWCRRRRQKRSESSARPGQVLEEAVRRRENAEDRNRTDAVQISRDGDTAPENRNNRKYARGSAILIAFDRVLRYVRDPTMHWRTTQVPREYAADEGTRLGVSRATRRESGVSFDTSENVYEIVDSNGPQTSTQQSETDRRTKKSDFKQNPKPLVSGGRRKDDSKIYENIAQLEHSSTSRDPEASKPETQKESVIYENQDQNAESLRDNWFESARPSQEVDNDEEHVYKNIAQSEHSSKSRDPEASTPDTPAESVIYENAESLRDSGFESARSSQEVENDKEHVYGNSSVTNFNQNVPPVFSQSWQFCETFSTTGGRLQGEQSSVFLKIPTHAVDGSMKPETIQGAVCTNLEEVHCRLKLPADECIVSPVVEYEAGSGASFRTRKPMEIVLPHFLHPSFSGKFVKVYRFHLDPSGDFDVKQLPLGDKHALKQKINLQNPEHDAGVYCFNKNNQILILTTHFCGYLCTYCKKEYPPSDLYLEVFAKHVTEGRQTSAAVRLYVWDNRFTIKDFTQNRHDLEGANSADMKLIDRKQLSALRKHPDLSKFRLGAQLDDEDEQTWKHSVRKKNGTIINQPQRTIDMDQFVPCASHFTSPHRVDWSLTAKRNTAPAEYFHCLVDVGYVTIADDRGQGPLDFLQRPEHQIIEVKVKKTTPSMDDGRQNVQHARIAKKTPSDQQPRRQITPCMSSPPSQTSCPTRKSPPYQQPAQCAAAAFPPSAPPRVEDSSLYIQSVDTLNLYSNTPARQPVGRGPTTGPRGTPHSMQGANLPFGYRPPVPMTRGRANAAEHIYNVLQLPACSSYRVRGREEFRNRAWLMSQTVTASGDYVLRTRT